MITLIFAAIITARGDYATDGNGMAFAFNGTFRARRHG